MSFTHLTRPKKPHIHAPVSAASFPRQGMGWEHTPRYEKIRVTALRPRSQMPRILPHCLCRVCRPPDPIIPIKDSFSYSNRYPFQRSRPPRRRPRYPSLGMLSSMQAPYRSLPHKRESSFTPLHLLFRQNHPILPEPDHGILPQGNIISRCRYSIVGSIRHI